MSFSKETEAVSGAGRLSSGGVTRRRPNLIVAFLEHFSRHFGRERFPRETLIRDIAAVAIQEAPIVKFTSCRSYSRSFCAGSRSL
jgi:hypothetical protein